MTYQSADPFTIARILDLVKFDVCNARSEDDLKGRLARFGYGFRDTSRGRMLTTVPHGVEIARLPATSAAI